VRQGVGNPIIDLSRNLDEIANKVDSRVEENGYIFSNNLPQVVETLANVNGTDELKYLAWTNKEVDMINKLVRLRIYGESPNKVELDETLVFNEPYKEEYYTNQEIKVESVEIKEKDFLYPSGKINGVFEKVTTYKPIKLKYYAINKKLIEGVPDLDDNIIIIHEDSEADFQKLLKDLSSMCRARIIDWVDFFRFKEGFADMKYNHAITIHKSQGSTYKQAIVNIKNIGLNKNKTERARLLYTAITRASKLLILYKV
jgi:exodeoxyribonuclease-5